MPELPEVETMVRGIQKDCTNRRVERLEFVRSRRRPIPVFPARASVVRRMANRRILGVTRLAKRIVLALDSEDVMIIEPRMTGLLLISPPPTQAHRRVVWHLNPSKGLADQLEFWDRRGLGTVSLLDASELAELRARLGPDALEITFDEWKTQLNSTSREIKVALLDQHLVAGIGNLYASEILHRAGISPLRSATTLGARRLARLDEATKHILQEAILYEGSTLNDGTYRNALNKDGTYQNHHRVYQRAGQRCASCKKSIIQRIVQAQRATFFCSRCQK